MTGICITKYNAICNLGNDIDEIFENAVRYGTEKLEFDREYIQGKGFYYGKINAGLPCIEDKNFDIRANRILKKCLEKIDLQDFFHKYKRNRVAIVLATTNSGIEEFGNTQNIHHSEIGNPALFLQKELKTSNYAASISTACSSGIKVFSTAKRLIENNVCDAVIAGGVDSLAHVAVHGFNSLEVLSKEKSIPFSKNRKGINIGEAAALFTIEKSDYGYEILSVGETSDAYHASSPEPTGIQAARAIETALKKTKISVNDVDYINLHGTGTLANDAMEANAIFKVFKDNVFCSSTKQYTGHCLGAAAALETALCCHMIKKGRILKHIYDGEYDLKLPHIKLAEENMEKVVKIALCNAFGFGGTNSIMLIGKKDK